MKGGGRDGGSGGSSGSSRSTGNKVDRGGDGRCMDGDVDLFGSDEEDEDEDEEMNVADRGQNDNAEYAMDTGED